MIQKLHFTNLHDYHQYLGIPGPEHPLFSVINMQSDTANELNCPDVDVEISTDFYSISLKHILEGDIFYGRTKYDFKNGSLICMAPRQVVRTQGLRVKTQARIVLIHEDFLRGTPIQERIENSTYFSYSVNEALHLSPQEEALVSSILDTLEQEYDQPHDAFSKDILVSQLNTMLTYTERFYQRQFQQRKESQMTSIESRFYSALKLETGHTALENIHIYQI
ncbi:hypothetical protein, partial [Candidatus Pelagadaptatus aseana]|uniref:hypothetical protein n=1 Tax=Candidatus Pelagadaptatus aseana TaxID=3120508 RepID=UPI003C704E97